MTAIAVAGVTMASAPPASAGVIPGEEFRYPVGGWTAYGWTNNIPFVSRSLDPESIDAIDLSEHLNEIGQNALGLACNAAWQDQGGGGGTCIEAMLAVIQGRQSLSGGQLPFYTRVYFYPYEYVTVLYYPSG